MKKVLRDETTKTAIGWTDTKLRKGTSDEFADSARYTRIAVVAETMISLDHEEREYIKELGEWN